MALRLSGGLAPFWHTPKTDAADQNPPAFLLQPLTEVQTMEVVADGTITEDGRFIPSHAGRLKLLGWGVKNWRNVEDENGAPAEFKPGSWQKLPWNLQIELADQVMARSALREDERKNSPSQSPSLESPSDSIAPTANGAATAIPPAPRPSPNG